MFLINGELLNEKTHEKEYAWMMSKMKEIKDEGKEIFTYNLFTRKVKILRDDNRLVSQRSRKRTVSMIGSTTEATGLHQTWTYAPSQNALKADGVKGYTPRRYNMALDEETQFSVSKDIDLIFFFQYLTNNKHVKRIDYDAINKNEAIEFALKSKAQSLIYAEDSPLSPTGKDGDVSLKNIALAWGITNALSLDAYTIMRELWVAVQNSQGKYAHTKRGYKEFIDSVLKYSNSDKRANVTLAINKGVLVYEKLLWKMILEGSQEQFLCGVDAQDEKNKEAYVIDYIIGHETLYQTMVALLNRDDVYQKEDTTLDNMNRFSLIKIAKDDLGWGGEYYDITKRMSKEDLLDLIKNKKTPTPDSLE